jgi:PTS system mannose-specific IIA component
MIGVVIVTHGQLGAELVKAAETVKGCKQKCQSVAIETNISPDFLSSLIGKAIKAQDSGKGVLILTDMFGGTPSNISRSFHEEGKIEILTGANLPMLLRVFDLRSNPEIDLKSMALNVLDYARKSFHLTMDNLN